MEGSVSDLPVSWLKFSNPAEDSDTFDAVAVAIGPRGTSPAEHTGVLYRRRNEPVRFLHLDGHYRLKDETPRASFAWVHSNLPRARAMQVAARCRQIARKNLQDGIPYALRYQHTRFASSGELLWGRVEYGLTCATFVLAVFSSVGLRLLKLEEWPKRIDDLVFQDSVFTQLRALLGRYRKKRASLEGVPGYASQRRDYDKRIEDLERHLKRLQQELGCARYRPAEVAGASAESRWPVSFNRAEQAARQIDEALASPHD